jgi:hypothetical protein
LKKLCDVESDTLMENLSSSFSVEAYRFWAAIFRNSRQRPRGRRWDFEEKVLALCPLKRSPKSYPPYTTPPPIQTILAICPENCSI